MGRQAFARINVKAHRPFIKMKTILKFFPIIFLLIYCSEDKVKFELFSPEAFAYSLDSGWELNATCRIRGFVQKETENKFIAKLSYEINLLKPDGTELTGVQEGLINKEAKEKFSEAEINSQIQLDSTYQTGKYSIVFVVTDNFSGKTITTTKDFEISN